MLVGAGALALGLPWVVVARSGAPAVASVAAVAPVPVPAVVSAAAPPASASPTPTPVPTPTIVPVVEHGNGELETARGGTRRSGTGPLKRYDVRVEQGLGVSAADFAAEVDRTLADPRSWGADARMSFRRVASGPVDFRVVLASPDTTDRLCRPLSTGGIYSCGNGDTAVINSMRWLRGADAYRGALPEYRQYVVNHEVGHTLGHGHATCPGRGEDAPVMMQQTKGVGACRAVPWPYP